MWRRVLPRGVTIDKIRYTEQGKLKILKIIGCNINSMLQIFLLSQAERSVCGAYLIQVVSDGKVSNNNIKFNEKNI